MKAKEDWKNRIYLVTITFIFIYFVFYLIGMPIALFTYNNPNYVIPLCLSTALTGLMLFASRKVRMDGNIINPFGIVLIIMSLFLISFTILIS